MSHEEILQQLSAIIAEVLDLEDLTLTTEDTAKDIDGWDSISHIHIMVAVEQAFGFRFRTGELSGTKNVGGLIDRIVKAIASDPHR